MLGEDGYIRKGSNKFRIKMKLSVLEICRVARNSNSIIENKNRIQVCIGCGGRCQRVIPSLLHES